MEKPVYEVMLVFRTDRGEETLETSKTRFLELVKSHGAEITRQDEWGKRRLAYPILKQMEGYFLNLYLQGEPTLVGEIKTYLQTETVILRSLVIRVTKKQLEEDARKKKLAEESQARAAAEAQARAEARARAEAAAAEAAASAALAAAAADMPAAEAAAESVVSEDDFNAAPAGVDEDDDLAAEDEDESSDEDDDMDDEIEDDEEEA